MKFSSVIIAGLLFTTACSKVKELDDRTKKMEQSTEKVSTTTDEMKDTTSIMYQQIRSKEAEDTRDEKFEILMSKEADFGTRITAAGVYYKSMEFQLHTQNGDYDNQENLKEFYLDAANEFTRRMCDLYEKINIKKMSPTKNDKMEMSFYSLAVAVHMNHSFHDLIAKSKKEEAVSMYDLIKKALRKDAEGKRLNAHEEVLMAGINKEIMIELLRARVDILSALALKNLTDKRDMTLGQKAKALLFKVTGGKYGDIVLPEVYDKSNEATKIYIEKYLDGAVKTKAFLAELQLDRPVEKTVKTALKNVDLGSDDQEQGKDFDKYRDSIRNHINELLK